MKNTRSFVEMDSSHVTGVTSEVEMIQLIEKSMQQYEEIIRLAHSAEFLDDSVDCHSRYAWDNPIGLVLQ